VTLFEAYQRVAVAKPDQPAISYHRSPYVGTVLTWQGVVDRSRAIADKLAAAGVDSGGRCAVIMEDHPDIVPVVLAVWLRGAVVVPVDSAWGADITRSVLTLSGADVVIDAERDTCTGNTWARAERTALPPDTAMISYTS
jgi:acyl-CoA synthetase (AMP-forming)/AMP-acid ligase II